MAKDNTICGNHQLGCDCTNWDEYRKDKEMAAVKTCKHGARLYDQTGQGDWFHAEKCTPGCLPEPCDPGNFRLNSAIEEVDGWFFEWFSNGSSRTVAGPETCCKCGYGFEDIEDLFSPQDRVESWRHVLCPGVGS